jgi:hypothetical protein
VCVFLVFFYQQQTLLQRTVENIDLIQFINKPSQSNIFTLLKYLRQNSLLKYLTHLLRTFLEQNPGILIT